MNHLSFIIVLLKANNILPTLTLGRLAMNVLNSLLYFGSVGLWAAWCWHWGWGGLFLGLVFVRVGVMVKEPVSLVWRSNGSIKNFSMFKLWGPDVNLAFMPTAHTGRLSSVFFWTLVKPPTKVKQLFVPNNNGKGSGARAGRLTSRLQFRFFFPSARFRLELGGFYPAQC